MEENVEWFKNIESKWKDKITLNNEWDTIYESLKKWWLKHEEASKSLDEIRIAIDNFNKNWKTIDISESKFDEQLKLLVWKLNSILSENQLAWDEIKTALINALDLKKFEANIQVSTSKWNPFSLSKIFKILQNRWNEVNKASKS